MPSYSSKYKDTFYLFNRYITNQHSIQIKFHLLTQTGATVNVTLKNMFLLPHLDCCFFRLISLSAHYY